jgi:hypothetical protein
LSDVPDTEKDHEKEGSAFRNSTWWTVSNRHHSLCMSEH